VTSCAGREGGAARGAALAAAIALAALATPRAASAAAAPGAVERRERALREKVVRAAGSHLGRPFPGDCSGYVLAALRAAGVHPRLPPARSRSESLHRASRRVARPRPGDLAFFHDTYDRDRDGRRNDRFTHVALVEAVDGTTVTLLHRGRGRVERVHMDLARPSDPAANDPIRVRRRSDAPGVRTLAGELFAAFGELLPGEVTQMLQAGRRTVTGAPHPAPR